VGALAAIEQTSGACKVEPCANKARTAQSGVSQLAKEPVMLIRKSMLIAVLAAVSATPMVALADGFVRSNSGASYQWDGAHYDRVNGHWQRVDRSDTNVDPGTVSGFVGRDQRDAPQNSPDENAFGSTDGDTRFDDGMTSS
jgi:hypothetical protein